MAGAALLTSFSSAVQACPNAGKPSAEFQVPGGLMRGSSLGSICASRSPTGIAEATCHSVMQMERVLSPSSCPAGHGCTEEVFGGGLCASDAGMAPPDLNEQIRFFSRSDRFICAIMSGSCARCVLRVSNTVVENSTRVVGRRERL